MTTVGLRPATPADSGLCYELHRAAMRGYVEAIWGWDEAAQRDYHQRSFDPTCTRIITIDGRDGGVLIVDYRPAEIYLGRIELHPDYQGRGIGGHLIQQLLHEAATRHQPLILDVLTVNPRAYQLYRRLGFQEVGRYGENSIKIRMRAEPARP
ncbi:GNAT family N-acetyltransferase [Saccharopolyspora sp. K220]|uniref:GNAT family N-acetyltransferase n=1 Tax=Saccharopolyspora soli TaxID=2926618 RepID=UPI001F5A94D7|nr:GNAT family N-acetyltransferase [Saccharopolyspora soli]MCI2420721.1 GNAT family N-acetyltransferase [Saccharopolyspora soli]